MVKKQKLSKEVGASKAARWIFGSFDRRFRDPAGSIVRFSGFVILALIVYLILVGSFSDDEYREVVVWLIVYGAYLLLLELLRAIRAETYDQSWFRSLRVIINFILMTLLISFSSNARPILVFAYAVPIFASIVYYSKYDWAWIPIVLVSVLGLFLGVIQFPSRPLDGMQFLWMSLIVIGYSYAFNWFYRQTLLTSNDPIDQVARRLPRSLDLQNMVDAVIPIAINLTQADYGLLIVFNKKYIAHALQGFTLRNEYTIEYVAQECSNLSAEKPFKSPDLIVAFNNGSIYHKYFNEQPRSTLSFPLF